MMRSRLRVMVILQNTQVILDFGDVRSLTSTTVGNNGALSYRSPYLVTRVAS